MKSKYVFLVSGMGAMLSAGYVSDTTKLLVTSVILGSLGFIFLAISLVMCFEPDDK